MFCCLVAELDSELNAGAGGMKILVAIVFIIAISCIVGVVITVICCKRRQTMRSQIYMPTAPVTSNPMVHQTQQGKLETQGSPFPL